MLLAMDVGNTNTVIGIFKDSELKHHWRLETKARRTSDEYGIFFKELLAFEGLDVSAIDHIIVSCVVPELEFSIGRMSQRYFKLKPYFVDPTVKLPIKNGLKVPEELGADRLVNAVGALAKYPAPFIVVDFGTATTFDYIDARKTYRGGCIAPGIAISNQALFERASKLPQVEIARPKKVIGSSTISSIQSGVYYGYVGMVDAIVKKILKEAGTKAKVIATGGFTHLISLESKTIKYVEPQLTLEGLFAIHQFLQKKKDKR